MDPILQSDPEEERRAWRELKLQMDKLVLEEVRGTTGATGARETDLRHRRRPRHGGGYLTNVPWEGRGDDPMQTDEPRWLFGEERKRKVERPPTAGKEPKVAGMQQAERGQQVEEGGMQAGADELDTATDQAMKEREGDNNDEQDGCQGSRKDGTSREGRMDGEEEGGTTRELETTVDLGSSLGKEGQEGGEDGEGDRQDGSLVGKGEVHGNEGGKGIEQTTSQEEWETWATSGSSESRDSESSVQQGTENQGEEEVGGEDSGTGDSSQEGKEVQRT
ncbi:hypothetical protein CBR_g28047 [Chara braunii]|uniref:Uncharacterized protein n=1 Tax=Chara braunii TaxID=69332 RepID=A0A388L9F5_CHABU|nr:hypothetical protein CBR_g28047 [Chara braunii]|eukprot:GBG78823.1 hypothetical protein CBR_g28047 [Chara braunii]